ncbi:hypothetical protein FHL15_007156 [Xylaria flabelliformis]|uniref:DUF7580 domain-containing protein n=1 Tax=Xylaria flabelliformis TaxID=2512241 RepID=A0A553HV76_9PEZI|nr:hypothetical protein FHL15_007156 [Xylaria flabelliformis]
MPSDGCTTWHRISMNFQATNNSIDTKSPSGNSGPSSSQTQSPSRLSKLKDLLSPGENSRSLTNSLNIPNTTFSNSPQTTPAKKQEIHCLCDYLKRATQHDSGYIPDPDAVDNRLLVNLIPSTSQYMETASLPSFLGLSKSNQKPPSRIALSRKQRFSIAAAAVWAILYLYGSPWMGKDWSGKNEIQLFIEGSGMARQLEEFPTLVYIFRSALQQQPRSCEASISEAERFQSNQIRSKELYALGILLIELCLDTTFELIRRESQENGGPSAPLSINSSAVDDFEIANRQTDRIHLEAGDSYGYAVQRCLRCEFPGRDVTKMFDFSQFRHNFFNGVVAPVHATYMMLPASMASM